MPMYQRNSINFGQIYPYRYDRRHDIGIAVTHEINDNINILRKAQNIFVPGFFGVGFFGLEI